MGRRKFGAFDWASLVGRFTDGVGNPPQSALPNGNLNGSTSVYNPLSTNETFGTVHSNRPDQVLTKMSSDLEDETTTVEVLDFKSIENR